MIPPRRHLHRVPVRWCGVGRIRCLRSSCRGATPRHAPSYRNGYATSSADGRRDRRIDAISEENRVFLHWRSMPALNGGDP